MLPQTPLLCSPEEDNPFGKGMSHHDLMKGLRQCNNNLSIPQPDVMGWYPGKVTGHITLWLGRPWLGCVTGCTHACTHKADGGKKITTFHLGVLPEWSQVGPDGEIMRRGWRSVLAKVIKSGAATKRTVHRIFKCNLDYDDWDGYCDKCRAEGKFEKADTASKLCDLHEMARKTYVAAKQQQAEVSDQMRRLV